MYVFLKFQRRRGVCSGGKGVVEIQSPAMLRRGVAGRGGGEAGASIELPGRSSLTDLRLLEDGDEI